jgi:hypothetical protein
MACVNLGIGDRPLPSSHNCRRVDGSTLLWRKPLMQLEYRLMFFFWVNFSTKEILLRISDESYNIPFYLNFFHCYRIVYSFSYIHNIVICFMCLGAECFSLML